MPSEPSGSSSTWLEQTEARLRDGIQDDRLVLGPSSLEIEPDGAAQLLFSTLEVPELPLDAALIASADGVLTVRGTAALFGLEGLDVTLSLEQDEEEHVALDFRAALGDSAVPSFSDTAFAVEDVGVSLSIEGLPASVTGGLGGTIRFSEVELPIQLFGGSGGWTVRGDFTHAPLPGPADLLALAGADDLLSAVPGGLLDGGRALALTQLAIGFDPEAVALSFVSLGVAVAQDWELLPGRLALRDLELFVSVTRDGGGTRPDLLGRVEGTVDIAGRGLPLAVEVPAASGGVRIWLNTTDRIPLPGLSELATLVGIDPATALPPGLDASGDVWVSELALELDLANKRLPLVSFAFGVERAWTIVPDLLTVDSVEVALTVAHPADGSEPSVTGFVRGGLEVAGVGIVLSGELGEHLVLVGQIALLDLSRLAETLLGGVELPDELPDVRFEDVEVRLTPATGAFALRGAARIDWELGGSPVSAEVELSFDREGGGGPLACTLAVRAAGPAELADAVCIEALSLDFALEQGTSWSVSGGLSAVLLDGKFDLEASYEQVAGVRTLRLGTHLAPARALVDLEGLGSLHLESLAVELTKVASETTGERAQSALAFALSGSGRVVLANLADLAGHLRLHREDDGAAGLVFTPTDATAEVPLPVPGHEVFLGLAFGGLSLRRGARPANGASRAASGWRFEAATELRLRGLPAAIADRLPEVVNATLTAGGGEVRLTADRVLEPLELDLPDIEVGAARIALGRASLDATRLSIRLGSEVELSADLGLGLPAELNNLFGVKEDGEPAVDLFLTLDPARPEETQVKLRLAVGSAGVQLTPLTSPLQAIRLVEEDGKSYCYCDLGECGEVRLQVPVLSLEGTRFAASGGFEVVRPLQLPLTPLKLMLAGTGAAAALPDAIPLEGLDLFDDSGSFRVDELIHLLESVGGELPSEFQDGLALIGERLSRLPDGFKRYLDVELPKSFHFDLSIAPGSVRMDVGVNEGDPPIRLLVPGMIGTLPGLNGIELHNLAFGGLLGGSLFLLEVDARLDQFNLATLAASLLLPEDGNLPLPDTRVLERRLVIDKLFMIIVYQTGVPIPVPLFWDQLGVEYLGLEGVHLQAHASFPLPTFDLGVAARLLSGFKQFLTDRDYLLDTENPPESMNLAFGLGANYVQLPAYLGGRVLGSREDVGSIDAYSSLARFLNGLKTFELDPLIRAIPIERRVGTVGVAFGPLSLDVAWAITTPAEFHEETFRHLELAPEERSAALALLPAPDDAGDAGDGEEPTGLVVFLKGGTELEGVASLDVRFGLMASSASGFATGVRIAGSLAGALELELAGNIYVDPARAAHDSAFGLDAQGQLSLGGREILSGRASLDESSLTVAGAIDLFPAGAPLELKGAVLVRLGTRDFVIAGRIAARVLGIAGEADLHISERGLSLTLEGRIFGAFDCALVVRGGDFSDAGALLVSATMRNDLLAYLRTEATSSIENATAAAMSRLDGALAVVAAAQRELHDLDDQVESLRRTIQAERDRNRRALVDAQAQLASAQGNVNELQGQINAGKNRISTLKNQINSKYRWYTGQPWHQKAWAFGAYVGYATPRNAEIAATNVAIAGLETAKWAALGALELVKQAVHVVEGTVDTFPIDADARMVLVNGARGTAQVALAAAEIVLEGVRAGLGTAGEAASFIAEAGLGGVLDVREARFEALLGAADGGRVTLMLVLSYMGGPWRTLSLEMDFNNPLLAARSLGQTLLSA